MSTNDIIRKLLEGAKQGTLQDAKPPPVEPEVLTIDLNDFTEWEVIQAIEAGARVTDANHPQVTPRSRRIKKKKASKKQK